VLALEGNVQIISAIEIVSLILSIVALIVTVVGFFASLKFYRDGVTLQGKANDALTKIEERTQFIQTQVGGMFDKTLEAALGKNDELSASFEEISQQLELTKSRIVEQIGDAGGREERRLTQIVDAQIQPLREKVQTAKALAEEGGADENPSLVLGEIFALQKLRNADRPLQAWEIAKGIEHMSTSRALYFVTRLQERGLAAIVDEGHVITARGKEIADSFSGK
jgi:hypothetical protein